MSAELAAMAERVRPIPLGILLRERGFEPRKEGNSTMWRGNAWKINVTGESLWYDHKAGKGGNGAIDLIMYLEGLNFKEAVESLSGGKHSRLVALPAAVQLPPPRRPLSQLMKEFATRDDSHWPHALDYLTKRRCLPPDVVDNLYKGGRIYANDRGGIVFRHYDTHWNVAGATIKSTYSKFSQCVGNKTGAWFHVGPPPYDCQSIAITESPIDAISYSTLFPDRHLCVVSVAGQHVPDQLLQLCDHSAKYGRLENVIIGLDNPAFEKSETAGEITRGVIETTLSKCPNARLHAPTAKDWNDDLCMARKRHVKTL
jgi:hypothetical protein